MNTTLLLAIVVGLGILMIFYGLSRTPEKPTTPTKKKSERIEWLPGGPASRFA